MGKPHKDLTGKKFGMLTVEEYVGGGKYKCKCDCGNHKIASTGKLNAGDVKSCGCLKSNDLTRKKFGRLTAIKPTKERNRGIVWECKCDCGKTVYVGANTLSQGGKKSCGCLYNETRGRMKHGKHKDRIYFAYGSMIQRCTNESNPEYRNYGARGITICDEWLGEYGFEKFYDWAIRSGYSENLTIDRINVNGNYEPSNCRWTDILRQQNNKRNNHYISFNGKTQSMADWAREIGISYSALSARINTYKWTLERALTEPTDTTKIHR